MAKVRTTLNEDLLRTTLRNDVAAAWHALKAEHGFEELYGFGLYTTSSLSYVAIAAFSERGLDKVTEKYLASKYCLDKDAAKVRTALRWSPADSPLHCYGQKLMKRTDKVISALDFEGRAADEEDIEDEDDESGYGDVVNPEVLASRRIAISVLQGLDKEGIFGLGEERERLTISIWYGDQSNTDRYEFAKQLNSVTNTRRFGESMNAALLAGKVFHPAGIPWRAPKLDKFD